MKDRELANSGTRDFNGRKLCIPCWNGVHYIWLDHASRQGRKIKSRKVTNCAGDPCECECKKLLAERHPKIERDTSLQIDIVEQVGTITI